MDRRRFLQSAAAGGAGVLAGATAGPSAAQGADRSQQRPDGDRPNILVILADDMGFSDVGCYGSEIETPNVDRLAEEGVRFSQFYNAARCCPTRASLLTGLYPHQAGVGHLTRDMGEPGYRGYLNDRCVTVGEALQESGYRTAMAGKWHVGYKERSQWPTERGFDRFYGEHRYVDDYFKPTHQLYLNGEAVEPEGEDWYSTDAYTDYGLQFIEEAQADDQPFFLYMAYNAPHFPLQAFQEDVAKYRGAYGKRWADIRRQRHQRQIDIGLVDERWTLPEPSLLDPETSDVEDWLAVEDDSKRMWDLKMAAYAAQVDRMDQNIGRLLGHLEKTGALDNTLVLFLSDNGGCAEDWINSQNPEGVMPGERTCKLAYGPPWANVSDTPFRYYKRWNHEGGIATPLIARWPGEVPAGEMREAMGHVIDILPTCLDAAGAPYPSTYDGRDVQPVEGRSLLPVMRGHQSSVHDVLYWEHEGNRAVRHGDWKLVSRSRFTPRNWELYHMDEDRTETNDQAGQRPDLAQSLAHDYRRWAERAGVIPWPELTSDG
jgi:arylsulfatase